MSFKNLGWGSFVALLAALIQVCIAAFSDEWFDVVATWQVSLAGLIAIGIGIWRRRHWWLLLLAPIFLAPLGFGGMLLYACSQGDCL